MFCEWPAPGKRSILRCSAKLMMTSIRRSRFNKGCWGPIEVEMWHLGKKAVLQVTVDGRIRGIYDVRQQNLNVLRQLSTGDGSSDLGGCRLPHLQRGLLTVPGCVWRADKVRSIFQRALSKTATQKITVWEGDIFLFNMKKKTKTKGVITSSLVWTNTPLTAVALACSKPGVFSYSN